MIAIDHCRPTFSDSRREEKKVLTKEREEKEKKKKTKCTPTSRHMGGTRRPLDAYG